MKTYDFFGIFRRLISVGLAVREKVGNHAKGKMRSQSLKKKCKEKRRRIRKLAKIARRLTRPRHTRRRRVASKGKSAHSSRSW